MPLHFNDLWGGDTRVIPTAAPATKIPATKIPSSTFSDISPTFPARTTQRDYFSTLEFTTNQKYLNQKIRDEIVYEDEPEEEPEYEPEDEPEAMTQVPFYQQFIPKKGFHI